jgi:hypothetical protein
MVPTSQTAQTLSMRMPLSVFVTCTTSATGTPKLSTKATPLPWFSARGAPQSETSAAVSSTLRDTSWIHQADAFGHRVGAGGMDQFVEEGVEDETGTGGATARQEDVGASPSARKARTR